MSLIIPSCDHSLKQEGASLALWAPCYAVRPIHNSRAYFSIETDWCDEKKIWRINEWICGLFNVTKIRLWCWTMRPYICKLAMCWPATPTVGDNIFGDPQILSNKKQDWIHRWNSTSPTRKSKEVGWIWFQSWRRDSVEDLLIFDRSLRPSVRRFTTSTTTITTSP